MGFYDRVHQAIVDYARDNLGETIDPEDIDVLHSSSALNIHKAIAIDDSMNRRLWLVTYDRFEDLTTVELYLPAQSNQNVI